MAPVPGSSEAVPRSSRVQLPNRNIDLCKVTFGAALSQVFYARRTFPPSAFQTVPISVIATRSFDDVVSSGAPLGSFDQRNFDNAGDTIFLREDPSDFNLSNVLGILSADIFPLLEKQQLVKFRVSLMCGSVWYEDNLLEHYTFALKYASDGAYRIDVWRAGIGSISAVRTDLSLWNLGNCLSRLSPLRGPIHATLAFHATERPSEPAIGLWGFDQTDFEDANLQLQQSPGYCCEQVVEWEIRAPSSRSDQRVSDRRAALEDPNNNVVLEAERPEVPMGQTVRSQLPGCGEGEQSKPPQGAAKSAVAKPKPKVKYQRKKQPTPQADQAVQHPKHSCASASNTRVVESPQVNPAANEKPVPKKREGTFEKKKKGTSTKRKPKAPLTIFEEVNSKLPETQEAARESQAGRENLQLGKRPLSGPAANTKTKRQKVSAVVHQEPPSSHPFRQIDGVVTSPGFSVPSATPAGEAQDSSSHFAMDEEVPDTYFENFLDEIGAVNSAASALVADVLQGPTSPPCPSGRLVGHRPARRIAPPARKGSLFSEKDISPFSDDSSSTGDTKSTPTNGNSDTGYEPSARQGEPPFTIADISDLDD
ncbi:hypothetical protein OQA88_2648 [Cercophora sp. LCS_1]